MIQDDGLLYWEGILDAYLYSFELVVIPENLDNRKFNSIKDETIERYQFTWIFLFLEKFVLLQVGPTEIQVNKYLRKISASF